MTASTKIAGTKIDVSDIQGFALKGYNFPFARYLLLELTHVKGARDFIGQIVQYLTTGERWDKKPASTVNIAFTFHGLAKLELPDANVVELPGRISARHEGARRDSLRHGQEQSRALGAGLARQPRACLAGRERADTGRAR